MNKNKISVPEVLDLLPPARKSAITADQVAALVPGYTAAELKRIFLQFPEIAGKTRRGRFYDRRPYIDYVVSYVGCEYENLRYSYYS